MSTTGVILAQLGTPDAPTPAAVRRFLAEFLWDPRVVDLPRLPWWLILHGIILRRRPRVAAAAYRSIWTPEGSPILLHSLDQARGLGERLSRRLGHPLPVEVGMRYGTPSLAAAVERTLERGCTRLLVFPLYPQYCVATTASILDRALETCRARVHVPAVRSVPPFPTHPAYIRALASLTREHAPDLSPDSGVTIFSFHGEPQRYREMGDPYESHCRATAEALRAALGLPQEATRLVYQSRFGREPWLEPTLFETLETLARQGRRAVTVITPGFAADCLETLEEVGIQARRVFLEAGGSSFTRVPCLNAHPEWIQALETICLEELSGWEEPAGD